MMKAHLFFKEADLIGEAITWIAESKILFWLDIDRKILHQYDTVQREIKDLFLLEKPTTIIPGEYGKIILSFRNGLMEYDYLSSVETTICNWETNGETVRTNDGKASPDGYLFLGEMNTSDLKENGSLYRIGKDLEKVKVLDKQSIPNGIVWSMDGKRMYYADSGRGCVEEYLYSNGEIHFNRIAIQVPIQYGVPDGICIDAEDRLWIAHWGGFGVFVWDPITGKLLDKVELPVPQPASCTFDTEGHLYITTARSDMSKMDLKKYPLSGSLFIAEVSVKGGINHYPFSY